MTDDAEATKAALQKRRKVERKPPAAAPRDDGARPIRWVKALPEDCPVVALGHHSGALYFLDAAQQLRTIEAEKLSRLALINLFGDANYLATHWDRRDANGTLLGWRPEQVAETLTRAAFAAGVIDVADKVRGRGAWRGSAGELIFHCGDVIVIGPKPGERGAVRDVAPGMIDGFVYPRAPRLPRPLAERVDAKASPAEKLLALIKSWNWVRPIDPHLLLGWIVAAMIGGALDWRPLMWITGGTGTGKSTLQAMLRAFFGDALISVSDTSAAGVWQKLKHQTLPVGIDELEAEEDPRKANNVIKVARQAASGGVILRGGANHEGAEFKAQACFLFSSILIPPMPSQDRNRMAVLALRKLADGARSPLIKPEELGLWCAMLRRRMLDEWDRFAPLLELYRAALEAQGHSARGSAQFGTLLACADLALHDLMPNERDGDSVAAAALQLNVETLAETADDVADERAMLQHLMSQSVDIWNDGHRKTLGEWVAKAAKPPQAPQIQGVDEPAEDTAAHAIQRYGLKIVERPAEPGAAPTRWLAIANSHAELAKFFAGTRWRSVGGDAGAWVQAARRVPGHQVTKAPIYFASAGVVSRATLLPIGFVLARPAPVTDAND